MKEIITIGSLNPQKEFQDRVKVYWGGYKSEPESNGLQGSTETCHKICCKLDKMPQGKLTSLNEAKLCDFFTETASTVTARYYKGIGSHKDNMVLEIIEKRY